MNSAEPRTTGDLKTYFAASSGPAPRPRITSRCECDHAELRSQPHRSAFPMMKNLPASANHFAPPPATLRTSKKLEKIVRGKNNYASHSHSECNSSALAS